MNVQSIVLLMAVMAVGSMGAASQAFAADAPVPLEIESNGVNFDHNSTIEINGQVGNMRETMTVLELSYLKISLYQVKVTTMSLV